MYSGQSRKVWIHDWQLLLTFLDFPGVLKWVCFTQTMWRLCTNLEMLLLTSLTSKLWSTKLQCKQLNIKSSCHGGNDKYSFALDFLTCGTIQFIGSWWDCESSLVCSGCNFLCHISDFQTFESCYTRTYSPKYYRVSKVRISRFNPATVSVEIVNLVVIVKSPW